MFLFVIMIHRDPGLFPQSQFSGQMDKGPDAFADQDSPLIKGVVNNPYKAMKKCARIGKLDVKSAVMYRRVFTTLQPVANPAWTFSDDVSFTKSNTR